MNGFGYGLFSLPDTSAVIGSAESKHPVIASGIIATMRSIGQIQSMAVAMFCIAIFIGPVPIAPAIYPALMTSITVAFAIFTVLCGIGAGVS